MKDIQHKTSYILDHASGQLLANGQEIPLKNMIFNLLEFFLSRPGVLVKTREIQKYLWPDTYVTEGLVREYVHDLRQILNDDPKNPDYIQTVHGRGYRYIGDIKVVNSKIPLNDKNHSKTQSPIVAVLPIKNLSDTKQWDNFSAGITDDIITDLTRFSDLRVIANYSSSRFCDPSIEYRQIKQKLGADYILEGTIQVYTSKIRVTVQLIYVEDSTHIWAERYDRNTDDLFSIKNDVVMEVTAAIGGFDGAILRKERSNLNYKDPKSLQVYEMYLHAYELEETFTKNTNREAINILKKAILLDSSYARLWLVLSWAYYFDFEHGWTNEPLKLKELQNQCIRKAVELDPRDPLALKEMGILLMQEGNTEEAINVLDKAAYLGRNYPDLLISIARYIFELNDNESLALEYAKRAFSLNPFAPTWYYMVYARILYFTRQFDKALQALNKSIPDLPQTLYLSAFSLAQLGQTEDAILAREKFLVKYPNYDFKLQEMELALIRKDSIDLFWEGYSKAGFSCK